MRVYGFKVSKPAGAGPGGQLCHYVGVFQAHALSSFRTSSVLVQNALNVRQSLGKPFPYDFNLRALLVKNRLRAPPNPTLETAHRLTFFVAVRGTGKPAARLTRSMSHQSACGGGYNGPCLCQHLCMRNWSTLHAPPNTLCTSTRYSPAAMSTFDWVRFHDLETQRAGLKIRCLASFEHAADVRDVNPQFSCACSRAEWH